MEKLTWAPAEAIRRLARLAAEHPEKSHMTAPTKAILVSNSNSLMGTAKGHYENVVNVYPKVDFIAVSEWWWTASCEYADVVFSVDSWAEFKYPDVTVSVMNPFVTVFPLPRWHGFTTRATTSR